jgi:hypothetical protein
MNNSDTFTNTVTKRLEDKSGSLLVQTFIEREGSMLCPQPPTLFF